MPESRTAQAISEQLTLKSVRAASPFTAGTDLLERRQRPPVERDLPDERNFAVPWVIVGQPGCGRLQDALEQRVDFIDHGLGAVERAEQPARSLRAVGVVCLPGARPQDDRRQRHVPVEGREVAEAAGTLGLLVRARRSGPLENHFHDSTEPRPGELRDLSPDLPLLPPPGHRDDDLEELAEVQASGDQALQVRDVRRVGLVARVPRTPVLFEALREEDGHGASGARPIGRNQQIARGEGLRGERDPDVAEDRRILQLPPIVGRTEEDELDEGAGGNHRN